MHITVLQVVLYVVSVFGVVEAGAAVLLALGVIQIVDWKVVVIVEVVSKV